MEIQSKHSETGAGSCGRCENCQCGRDEPLDEIELQPPQAAAPDGSLIAAVNIGAAKSGPASIVGGGGR